MRGECIKCEQVKMLQFSPAKNMCKNCFEEWFTGFVEEVFE